MNDEVPKKEKKDLIPSLGHVAKKLCDVLAVKYAEP
jgi:hypothetical protein